MNLVDMGPKFQIRIQKCGFVWKWLVGLCYIITNKPLNNGWVMIIQINIANFFIHVRIGWLQVLFTLRWGLPQ